MQGKSCVRIALHRSVAVLLCVVTVSIGGRLQAAPADVFSSPAPAVGADPPKAAERRTGDSSVSTQNGSLSYSYPIAVPPGRGGMAPNPTLTYSSQAAIYGGIASGWSLPIPMILEDTSQGRLRTHSGEVEYQQGTVAPDDDRFISTMAGSRPLIKVYEPPLGTATFRSQNDASYTRYQKFVSGEPISGAAWRAYTTDGQVLLFGQPTRANCPSVVGVGYAPLTSQIDSFGNEVAYWYQWSELYSECRLVEITWGMNPNAGFSDPFATVAFGYGSGTAHHGFWVGSRTDYRSGKKMVSGASPLTSITVTAFTPGPPPHTPVHTRVISLVYAIKGDGSTTAQHSPQRVLTSIQESAWRGANEHRVDLPAVTFDYESPAVSLGADSTSGVPWNDPGHVNNYPNNLGWGYRHNDDRWPTVEQMLVDLDGDGLLDKLTNTSEIGGYTGCAASWQRNKGLDGTGKLAFAAGGTITLPRLKWGSGTVNQAGSAARRGLTESPSTWEGCSLNGQHTTYVNSAHLGDYCHDGSACFASTDPKKPGQYFCGSAGTECPADVAAVGSSDYRTYLAYRWIDADGDGLTDLVGAVHGSIDRYDIERGNLPTPASGINEPFPFAGGSWPACPGAQEQVDLCREVGGSLDNARECDGAGVCTTRWDIVNEVLGSTDAVACFQVMAKPSGGGSTSFMSQAPYTRCEGLYPWFIFRNEGNGTFPTAPIVKYQPVPLESDGGDSSLYSSGLQSQNHGVFDFDGDGILDGVVHAKEVTPLGTPDGWFVWLGDGTGGMGPKRYFVPTRKTHSNASQFQTADAQNRISASIGSAGSSLSLHLGTVDLNGDGLADHYLTATDSQSVPTDSERHRWVPQRLPDSLR